MPHVSLRIDFAPDRRIGPGKILLLERIRTTGSISAAGRTMDMSYRRAWLLVDGLNQMFTQTVVATKLGGRAGGGAELTPFGEGLIARYREMELTAAAAIRPHLDALKAALAASPAAHAGEEQPVQEDGDDGA